MIEVAWRAVPYPGDDKIFTPDSHDDEDILNYFGGTSWVGHEPGNLRAHSSAFTFFTPEAFHYWLPAFMIAAIQDPAEADVICDYIPLSLTNNYKPTRWSMFSPAQRQSVAAYLRLQIERVPDASGDERDALCVLESVN
jgi:hypothetical protein